jgi:NADH:ubiquinone oxidoreductase subunit 6 (subunit J)/NADH:ubiquinone oxidoreductase subunit 3 (subunit A)
VELLLSMATLNGLLPLLAILAGIFVITTKNAIISVFNLIVLYILVSFYLIYLGVTYIGISYVIIYIGAIAILFLFIIMMIDIEVVEKRSNNYLPLLLLFLSGFLFSLKKILYNIGLIKMKSLSFKEELVVNESKLDLYSIVEPISIHNINYVNKNNNNVSNNSERYSNSENISGNFDNNNYLLDNENNHFYNNYLLNDNYRDTNSNNNDKGYFLQKIKGDWNEWTHKWEYLYMESDISIPWDWNNSRLFLGETEDIKDVMGHNEIFTQRELQDSIVFINHEKNQYINIIDSKFTNITNNIANSESHYLLIAPSWDSAANRITQITAIGDVLYTVYHSYIYIVSVILLLGMVGAIILTADSYQQVRILNISRHKKSNLLSPYYLINVIYGSKLILKKIWFKINYNYLNNYNYFWKMKYIFSKYFIFIKNKSYYKRNMSIFKSIQTKYNSHDVNHLTKNKLEQKYLGISSYFHILHSDHNQSERIIGNLSDFIIAILLVAFLLLSINSYLSLSIKYLEKGGGFECGFTSFVQTRERYNIYFYRVSLLFLVFDLEIILAFPYTAIYQKNQNISKNNVLTFLFILIVGFIFELKEGALNIVKKAHSTEINIQN